MPIYSRQNKYQGINAHLHSRLQHERAGWEVFHSAHIIHLAEAIDAILPPNYLVDPEKSLQIHEYHPITGEKISTTKTRKPDITIYDTTPTTYRTPSAISAAAPTLTLPASEAVTLDEEMFLTALGIREVDDSGELGKVVTWIELLSTANKPGGVGDLQYQSKRATSLQNGIALVEIDYLHESRSPVLRLPSYPDHEADAFPYSIVITLPRPSLEKGWMAFYGIGINELLPIIALPLAGEEAVALNCDAVYQRTFESLGSYSRRVDYEQEPVNIDTYWTDDQAKIKTLMAQVIHG